MNRIIFAAFFGVLLVTSATGTRADAEITLGDKGLRISQGTKHLQIGGRVQIDAVAFDEDLTTLSSGLDARRIWLELDAGLSDDWSVRYAYDFTAGVTQDAFVSFHGLPVGVLNIGQFKPQVGLSEQSSNKFLTFNERPTVIRALAPGRALGVGYNAWSPHTTFSVAAFGDSIDRKTSGSDPLRATSRFSYRPVVTDRQVLHFGTSVLYQEADDSNTFRLRARPAVSLQDTARVLDVSAPGNDDVLVNALEFAWFRGPVSLQGEYLHAEFDQPGSAVADGYYLQATLFTGGVTRNYKFERGTFGRPRLKGDDAGAWEFGLRFDRFDVSELGGGRIESWSLAVNRYLNKHLKFAVTLAYSDIINGVSGDESIGALQARLQWAF